jgi:hypothetical protein
MIPHGDHVGVRESPEGSGATSPSHSLLSAWTLTDDAGGFFVERAVGLFGHR